VPPEIDTPEPEQEIVPSETEVEVPPDLLAKLQALLTGDPALAEWRLHLGPGEHPSGSPQEVHGGGGGGLATLEQAPTAPLGQSKEAYVGKLPSYPEHGTQAEKDAWEAPYQAWVARKHAWTQAHYEGISEGTITPERAKALGVDVPPNPGQGWETLPKTLYHVTTARREVLASGLKTRDQLRAEHAGTTEAGLGGGASDTISFTDDPKTAEDILRGLRQAHAAASGRLTIPEMIRQAETGQDAKQAWDDGLRRYWKNDWQRGDPDPLPYAAYKRGRTLVSAWEHETFFGGKSGLAGAIKATELPAGAEPIGEGWTGGDGIQRYQDYTLPFERLPEKEQRIQRMQVFKLWSAFREHAGGPTDPLFFGTDEQALAALDPTNFGIVKVQAKPGTKGYRMSSLGEWRTHSGKAVRITGVAEHALCEIYLLHMGPGDHPSGSPQEAHGTGGGSGVGDAAADPARPPSTAHLPRTGLVTKARWEPTRDVPAIPIESKVTEEKIAGPVETWVGALRNQTTWTGHVKRGKPVPVYRAISSLDELRDAIEAGAWQSKGTFTVQGLEGRTQFTADPEVAVAHGGMQGQKPYKFLVMADVQGLKWRSWMVRPSRDRLEASMGAGLGIDEPIPLDRVLKVFRIAGKEEDETLHLGPEVSRADWAGLAANELLLHMGPGDHPSGSPQEVHGKGGGDAGGPGGAGPAADELQMPTATQVRKAIHDYMLPPEPARQSTIEDTPEGGFSWTPGTTGSGPQPPASVGASLAKAARDTARRHRIVDRALRRLKLGHEIKGTDDVYVHTDVAGDPFWIGKRKGKAFTGGQLLTHLGAQALLPHVGAKAVGWA
jgi:hypothetical protein